MRRNASFDLRFSGTLNEPWVIICPLIKIFKSFCLHATPKAMKTEGMYVQKSSSVISYFSFSLAAVLLESNSVGEGFNSSGQNPGIE
jgi:hypothetical protein